MTIKLIKDSLVRYMLHELRKLIDKKLDWSDDPSKVYATDSEGGQVMIPLENFEPVADEVHITVEDKVIKALTLTDDDIRAICK